MIQQNLTESKEEKVDLLRAVVAVTEEVWEAWVADEVEVDTTLEEVPVVEEEVTYQEVAV
jgi:hypothetical protein